MAAGPSRTQGWTEMDRDAKEAETFPAFWDSPGWCPKSPWGHLPVTFQRLRGEKAAQAHRDIEHFLSTGKKQELSP